MELCNEIILIGLSLVLETLIVLHTIETELIEFDKHRELIGIDFEFIHEVIHSRICRNTNRMSSQIVCKCYGNYLSLCGNWMNREEFKDVKVFVLELCCWSMKTRNGKVLVLMWNKRFKNGIIKRNEILNELLMMAEIPPNRMHASNDGKNQSISVANLHRLFTEFSQIHSNASILNIQQTASSNQKSTQQIVQDTENNGISRATSPHSELPLIEFSLDSD